MSSATRLISLQTAADQLEIDVSTLRRWVSKGLIKAYRVGPRSLRVSPTDVASLAEPLETALAGGFSK